MFDGELLVRPAHVAAAVLEAGVEAVSQSAAHSSAKAPRRSIRLLAGLGVEGDAHCGATDQHLFRHRADAPPNLRQLHLFPAEMIDALVAEGFAAAPGAIGENVLTRGVDLIGLPLHTVLTFPSGAVARLTGRRTPCRLVERLGPGLLKRLCGPKGERWGENAVAGVMAVIVTGGEVAAGDRFTLEPPTGPHERLPPL